MTYLAAANSGRWRPTPDPGNQLWRQQLAAYRLFLYEPGVFWLLPAVNLELGAMPPGGRGDEILKVRDIFLRDYQWPDDERQGPQDAIRARTASLAARHRTKDEADARIVAEAEFAELDALVSFDISALIPDLRPHTSLPLLTPSECWSWLEVPVEGIPFRIPGPGHPLERETWWRWTEDAKKRGL